jgi:hypothetical protein
VPGAANQVAEDGCRQGRRRTQDKTEARTKTTEIEGLCPGPLCKQIRRGPKTTIDKDRNSGTLTRLSPIRKAPP